MSTHLAALPAVRKGASPNPNLSYLVKHGDLLAGCKFSVVQLFTTTMPGGVQSEGSHQPGSKPAVHSCRRNISDRTSFVSDLRDHFHEFIHASMDEHRTCLTTTIKKMFGMSKAVAERSAEAQQAGAESVLPLQTSVSR
ncbi:hypothetical protein EJB05_23432, partial [Eragrostis curvula]